MTVGDQWVCKVCWKLNRPRDEACWRCKAPRGTTEEGEVKAHREVLEAKAAAPEPVPDIVVALPVTIFRGYGKAWVRGGFVMFGLLALLAFSGVDDFGYLAVTGAFGLGLIVCGLVAGEVTEGMRNREVWSYLVGIALSVAGGIGSVFAFNAFAPGLISPTAVRWLSLIIFGGAGIAAAVGLFMVLRAQRATPATVAAPRRAARPVEPAAPVGNVDDPGA
ncbi:MAG TPA: Ran-binding zinc finger domain-containing protein [Candidatus Limnocylindria bacterium]|nr:Ran-binding zinc finger domain-containing protein [Candidatus Limnocylindria bacterium]